MTKLDNGKSERETGERVSERAVLHAELRLKSTLSMFVQFDGVSGFCEKRIFHNFPSCVTSPKAIDFE